MRYAWFLVNLYGTVLLMVGAAVGVFLAPIDMIKVMPAFLGAMMMTTVNWIIALVCDQAPPPHVGLFYPFKRG